MGISVASGLRAVNELSMRHGEGHEKSHFPNRGSFAAERISTTSLKSTQRFDTVFRELDNSRSDCLESSWSAATMGKSPQLAETGLALNA
jgi:hypothetical protein